MSQLERYHKAMRSQDGSYICYRIERQHGLDGYPPELVSVGLKAIDEGKDGEAAVEAYIAEQQRIADTHQSQSP